MFRVYIMERSRYFVQPSDILDCTKVEQVFTGVYSRPMVIRCHCAAGNIVEYAGPYEIVKVEDIDHAKTDN